MSICLLKIDHDTAVVADPALGQTFRMERRELEAIWRHYIPIFKPSDTTLSTIQVSKLLPHPATPLSPGPTLTHRLSDFQQTNNLKRSGKLDAVTVLALQGPFIQDGPTLTHPPTQPMTIVDYHHLKS